MSGTDFYYRPQIDLAERLARVAPGSSPKKVFFTNSGAEALEAALKLARWHTRRNRVVAFFGAFHGRTYGAMSLSGSKLVHRRGFSPLVPDIHHVEFPRECPEPGRCANGCAVVDDIVDTVPVLNYDLDVAAAHAQLLVAVHRQGLPRGTHDLIIAATAKASNRTVVTADTTAFGALPDVPVRGHR